MRQWAKREVQCVPWQILHLNNQALFISCLLIMLTFYYAKLLIRLHNAKKKNVGGNSQARSAKGEGGQNLLKRILRLCSDPHWQTDLVIQEPEHLCQCVLENQEQESTPLESSTTFLSANWCIGETSLKVSSQ